MDGDAAVIEKCQIKQERIRTLDKYNCRVTWNISSGVKSDRSQDEELKVRTSIWAKLSKKEVKYDLSNVHIQMLVTALLSQAV
jgi:hypothetical protein